MRSSASGGQEHEQEVSGRTLNRVINGKGDLTSLDCCVIPQHPAQKKTVVRMLSAKKAMSPPPRDEGGSV